MIQGKSRTGREQKMTNNAVAPESETTDVITGNSIQTEPFYVNEYLTNKVFGGPEEGGWWYNVGKFERCHGVYVSVALAINRRKALRDWVLEKRREEGQRDINSVLCTGYTRLLYRRTPWGGLPAATPWLRISAERPRSGGVFNAGTPSLRISAERPRSGGVF